MEKYARYNEKFRKCFEFFDQHGAPGTPSYKQALKAMPFGQRFWFMFNFPVIFFGWIYFAMKGLVKQGLALIGITLLVFLSGVLVIRLLGVPDVIGMTLLMAVWLGFVMLVSSTVNYQIYLKEIKGVDTWNPFKGIGWR